MYLYLAIWLFASAVVMSLIMYRRALLRGGMAFAFSDPDVDMADYEEAFRHRLQLIDRWVRAVVLGFPGMVFGYVMLRVSWQMVHGTSMWQMIRMAVTW
jgi:hypothetical protein